MNYNKFVNSTWDSLDDTGNSVAGYHAEYLTKNDHGESDILIFKDEKKKLHLVVFDEKIRKSELIEPKVNGLNIKLAKYRFQNVKVKQFIDLECNLSEYQNEFSEIVREVAENILIRRERPINAINNVINNWRYFWATQIRDILSEEEQIGLICELVVLERLCTVNTQNALDSWKGPLKEKYDFIFSEWALEVKGTRSHGHIHKINGLNQLRPPNGKSLALISFLVSRTNNASSKGLQDHIEEIIKECFMQKKDLIGRFYELLVKYGYSKVHEEEYRNIKFDVYDGRLYLVDGTFPRLTSDDLIKPLNNRISDLHYKIDLEGMNGEEFANISIGKYFY